MRGRGAVAFAERAESRRKVQGGRDADANSPWSSFAEYAESVISEDGSRPLGRYNECASLGANESGNTQAEPSSLDGMKAF